MKYELSDSHRYTDDEREAIGRRFLYNHAPGRVANKLTHAEGFMLLDYLERMNRGPAPMFHMAGDPDCESGSFGAWYSDANNTCDDDDCCAV